MKAEEKIELIRAILLLESAVEKIVPRTVIRKHKRHMFKKQCSLCGKEFQGKQGVAVHMWKKHPVESSVGTTTKIN